VLAGAIFYPRHEARQILTRWRDLTSTMPDELTTVVSLMTAPPVPFLPESAHGTPIVTILGVYAGAAEAGEEAVRPLRSLGTPIADLMGPLPYVGMQTLLDPLWTPGAHNYFTSAFVEISTDDSVEALLRGHESRPTPFSEIHLHHLGGAFARVSVDATAFSQRDAGYLCNVIMRSPDDEGFDEYVAWARTTRDEIARYGNGSAYVNFTGEPGEDKVRASYPDRVYDRLVQVKDRYDSTNLFRLNQNIHPSSR